MDYGSAAILLISKADGIMARDKVFVKRWTKILLTLVGLVVVVIASIPLFVNANTFRPSIEKQLTTMLGRSVKLGDLSLSPFSGGLVTKSLSVSDDPNFSATPFLTAKELRIGVSLRRLILSRQVRVRSFQIESPQINMIRAVNGTWNFSSIGCLAASSAPAANPTTSGIPSGAAPEIPDLSIGRIVIEDGRAAIISLPVHGQPNVYEHVNLMARDFSFASQFPFEMSANLPAGGTIRVTGHVGPINLDDAASSPADAQISVKRLDPIAAGFFEPSPGLSFVADIDMHAMSDGQSLITSGTVHIQNLRLRKAAPAAPKSLDLAYNGTHRLKENTGQIKDATAKIGDAAIHVSGTYQVITLGAEDAVLNLKLAGQSLPIDQLRPWMTAAAIRLPNGSVLKSGTLSMSLAIIGHANALVITGAIALDNTRLVGFDIGSKVHGIAALGGVKTGDTTNIEKLRVNVRITNVGVVVDKIDAVIPAMGELTGSGTVSSADQLDFKLVVRVRSARGIGKVGVGLLTILSGSGGSSGNPSGVPMRVTGTLEDPYITADVGGIVRKKTHSIVSIFRKRK
jgi:AsmA protein